MTSFIYNLFLCLLCAILISYTDGNEGQEDLFESSHVRSILKGRMHRLLSVLDTMPRVTSCNQTAFIIITEIPYGNTGNNIIEFTHGLWLSKMYNYTFIVPPWIITSLHPFNLSRLHSHFCFSLEDMPPTKQVVLDVTSEDSFWLAKLFVDPKYNKVLPAFSEDVVENISYHFIAIYTALWAAPSHHVVNATAWLIENKLFGFDYTTAHKRSLEGGCNKKLSLISNASDFDPRQINMKYSRWIGNLEAFHPICEMPAIFATTTMAMHNRSNQHIYVAFDGRGSIDDYIAVNATFSSYLDPIIFPQMSSNNARKYVDMLVAMHGDFFILNPYSTYSFQVLVIRIVLGLESVPTLLHRDVYFQVASESPVHHLWVSYGSLISAFNKIKGLLSV